MSSPTPYDPPLTYSGWTQSRALGTRIASLVHEREQDPDEHNVFREHRERGVTAPPVRSKKRKHKVIIHTSPFARCIETAIAIGAGIAQFQSSPTRVSWRKTLSLRAHSPLRRDSVGDGVDDKFPRLGSIQEPDAGAAIASLRQSLKSESSIRRTPLRIDAFLGEWLSPDYFEKITPPPNSTMMVAAAKADLLRQGEYVEAAPTMVYRDGYFPGGWSKGGGGGGSARALSGISNLHRSNSHGSAGGIHGISGRRGSAALGPAHGSTSGVYVAPVPTYAVSASNPIPRGYVAHARDACIDVDLNWDSMREPLEWGDGGTIGEEWSAMHKRLRKGLTNMISWYGLHGDELDSNLGDENTAIAVQDTSAEEDDEETDLVLILVTHNTGCNAMIHALTNHPALIDVGLSSLTMAVHRSTDSFSASGSAGDSYYSTLPYRRPSVVDSGPADKYEIQLLASTAHLRPGADPANIPHNTSQPPSSTPGVGGASIQQRRHESRADSSATTSASYFDADHHHSADGPAPAVRPANSALGSMRRSSTTPTPPHTLVYTRSPSSGGGTTVSTAPPTAISTGLWGSTAMPRSPPPLSPPPTPTPIPVDGAHDGNPGARDLQPGKGCAPSPAAAAVAVRAAATPDEAIDEDNDADDDDDGGGADDDVPPLGLWQPRRAPEGQHGLWSSGGQGLAATTRAVVDRARGAGRTERQEGLKRRWTVSERSAGGGAVADVARGPWLKLL